MNDNERKPIYTSRGTIRFEVSSCRIEADDPIMFPSDRNPNLKRFDVGPRGRAFSKPDVAN